ncbi:MAG: hypothetical protein DRN49_01875 [Thaumarchaeota archaeon]|nr:MAG: hypothetical protein DRN49_01875 [Nitrososphaerota archaeon]
MPKWYLERGHEAYAKLMEYVRQNPFYAVAYAAAQGVSAPYEVQLRAVEELAMQDPAELADNPSLAEEIFEKVGAIDRERRAKVMARGARCYLEICGPDPEKCLTDQETRLALADCMFPPDPRIKGEYEGGKKSRDLLLLMLGDPEAVPVDRHVDRWICKVAKLYCPTKHEPGGRIPPSEYQKVQEAVRNVAEACGTTPGEMMVSAWVYGMCHSRIKRTKFPIVDDYYIYCQPTLEEWTEENWG